jgi:ribulose-5-phosphate 4-epimerase/fuculose-1-phosphate aldolase
MDQWNEYRKSVVNYSRMLYDRGYVVGTGGNVSVRIVGCDAVAITPSGIAYDVLTEEDVCIVNFELEQVEGEREPSIETTMHLTVYRSRPDVKAVIHTHQTYGSVFSIINEPIPALFDEQVLHLGDVVEVIPYFISGSEDLARALGERLNNYCNAYILQNHGVICLGMDLRGAYQNVEILERCAKIFLYALTTGREVKFLPKESRERFAGLLRERQILETSRKDGHRA